MLNIIKEYLVAVGFSVDNQAYQQAQKKLEVLESIVMNFGKGIQESEGFKALRAAIQKVSATVAEAARQAGAAIGKVFNGVAALAARFVTTLLSLLGPHGVLITAILASLATVTAAISLAITTLTGLFMSKMAAVDLEIRRLAINLLTTVENARSLKAVMDAMNINSIEDLKYIGLIPEQREQFLALRRLASELRPNADVLEGLKNIRRLGYEFQKLQLQIGYFFTNLAGTLGKVLEGPLKRVTRWVENINKFFTQNMKRIVDDMAILLGIFVKLAEVGAQIAIVLGKFIGVTGILDKLVRILEFLGNLLLYFLNRVSNVLDRYSQYLDNRTPGQKAAAAAATTMGWSLANPTLGALELWKQMSRNRELIPTFQLSATQNTGSSTTDTLGQLFGLAKHFNLRITSGYRTPEHNRAIGGAEGSLHTKRRAIDIDHRGVSPNTISKLQSIPGLQVIDETSRPGYAPHYHLQINDPAKFNEYYRRNIAPGNISIHINGATSPEATAKAVSRELQTVLGIRNHQGVFA